MLDVDTAIGALATLFEGAPEGAIFLTALGPDGAVHSLAARETDRVEAFLQRHDQAGAGLFFCVGTLLMAAAAAARPMLAGSRVYMRTSTTKITISPPKRYSVGWITPCCRRLW